MSAAITAARGNQSSSNGNSGPNTQTRPATRAVPMNVRIQRDIPAILSRLRRNEISSRRFASRPAAVVFGATGSASARPSVVMRAGSPMARASAAPAAFARAAESWKFDGNCTVRIGWLSV